MQLDQPVQQRTWSGTVPHARDARVVALVVAIAALAASVNVPYGGLPFAGAAFVTLVCAGVGVHILGERKLRRLTDGLVDRWIAAGAEIDDVTRTSGRFRTGWTVHTPKGAISVSGLALVPISRLSIEWQGTADAMAASDAEAELDRLADQLYREIFEFS